MGRRTQRGGGSGQRDSDIHVHRSAKRRMVAGCSTRLRTVPHYTARHDTAPRRARERSACSHGTLRQTDHAHADHDRAGRVHDIARPWIMSSVNTRSCRHQGDGAGCVTLTSSSHHHVGNQGIRLSTCTIGQHARSACGQHQPSAPTVSTNRQQAWSSQTVNANGQHERPASTVSSQHQRSARGPPASTCCL